MKALTVIIERTENNYSAYLAEVDGVIATGHSIDEIKANIVNAITVLLEDCREYGEEIPEELKGEYSLTFKMDVKSFLDFYTGIFTKAGLERIRPEQIIKIETALHKLGEELISINL